MEHIRFVLAFWLNLDISYVTVTVYDKIFTVFGDTFLITFHSNHSYLDNITLLK